MGFRNHSYEQDVTFRFMGEEWQAQVLLTWESPLDRDPEVEVLSMTSDGEEADGYFMGLYDHEIKEVILDRLEQM